VGKTTLFYHCSTITSEEKITKYLRNNVIERIIYIDLPAEFGIKDMELLKNTDRTRSKKPGVETEL